MRTNLTVADLGDLLDLPIVTNGQVIRLEPGRIRASDCKDEAAPE